MIRQKEFQFLLEKYSEAINEFWLREKKVIRKIIENKGRDFNYFEKPLENMFITFGDKSKLIKRINLDIGLENLNKLKKGKSFILTPGNIPLIEIQYLYFLIPVSYKILWRPSTKYIELSKKLLKYLKNYGFKSIKIIRDDIKEIIKKVKNFDYFVLVGSNRTLNEFIKNINKSEKVLLYGSRTSVSIISDLKGVKEVIKDITYFSHSGCLSPTIIFVKKNIFKKFQKTFIEQIMRFKNIFNEKEKLFNYYLSLSEKEDFIRTGEFYISINPQNILISKGFINLFEFSDFKKLIKKIKKFENLIQGISIFPYKENLEKTLKKNFKNVYIKKAGELQIIDEEFFPDGIKPLKLLLFNQ